MCIVEIQTRKRLNGAANDTVVFSRLYILIAFCIMGTERYRETVKKREKAEYRTSSFFGELELCFKLLLKDNIFQAFISQLEFRRDGGQFVRL